MQGDYNDAAKLERSVLSWNRSSLAIAANGALIGRAGVERDSIPVIVVGAAVVAIGAAVWFFSTGRYSSASSRLAGNVIADRRAFVGAAALFGGAPFPIALARALAA